MSYTRSEFPADLSAFDLPVERSGPSVERTIVPQALFHVVASWWRFPSALLPLAAGCRPRNDRHRRNG